MQRLECNKHNYLCINDSLKFLFPCENQGLTINIAEYMSLCDTCHRVKAGHQRPAGLQQPIEISKWKWEEIRMDFIIRLPRMQAEYDSIWVIVDRLTKLVHFIPVKTTYSGAKLTELYMSQIMCLHRLPKKIVLD
jgi:hypothetical protein